MSNGNGNSKRLYESGQIIGNVNFAVKAANEQRSSIRKRMYNWEQADDLSVRKGEAVFTPKRQRECSVGSRLPAPVLSSVNGMGLRCYDAMTDTFTQLMDMAKQMKDDVGVLELARAMYAADESMTAADLATLLEMSAYDGMRDSLFSENTYIGISHTEWTYANVGKQQLGFAVNSGGMMTLPAAGGAIHNGETVVVDFPLMDSIMSADIKGHSIKSAADGEPNYAEWGFHSCQMREGIPRSKRCMVFRALPRKPRGMKPLLSMMFDKMRAGFFRRGQVVGKCIQACKSGQTVDVNLIGNATGRISSADMMY